MTSGVINDFNILKRRLICFQSVCLTDDHRKPFIHFASQICSFMDARGNLSAAGFRVAEVSNRHGQHAVG